jgi:phospholipase/carboxylesterase
VVDRAITFTRSKALVIAGGLTGAALLTWGIVRILRRQPSYPKPDCSGVASREGELDGFRYLERVTPGADPNAALPMIVLFHSRGSRPESHAGMFYETMGRPVRVILPEGPHELGSYRSWTSKASKTTDQAAWTAELESLSTQLGKFMHDIVACRLTVGRPVITGSSEGGHMAYLVASRHPDLVQGAVAVAGYLPQALWNPDMAPTVGLHGEDDTAVPYARTQQYWDAMVADGAQLSFRSFPGVGHSVTSEISRAWRDALAALL